MRGAIPFLMILLAAAPAAAELSIRAPDSPASARLVEGWVRSDGVRIAAIEFTLAPGWHTYWRYPGEAGIAPTFDWSGSRNLAAVDIQWPRPISFDNSGILGFGYQDRLVLPVLLRPEVASAPIDLSVDVFFGVCGQICVPADASFATVLDPAAPPRERALIEAALADAPEDRRTAGIMSATCAIEPRQHGLTLKAELSFRSAPLAGMAGVIESGREDVWIGPVETATAGRSLVLTAPVEASDGAGPMLDRSSLKFTLIGQSRAVEIDGCAAPN